MKARALVVVQESGDVKTLERNLRKSLERAKLRDLEAGRGKVHHVRTLAEVERDAREGRAFADRVLATFGGRS